MQKPRVLVVDWNQDICDMYQDFLEAYGYLAIATQNPRLARSILAVFCPNLLILPYWVWRDKDMADLVASCQHNYPIIYVCAWANVSDLSASHFFNGDDIILEQPVTVKELLQAVKARLAKSASD